MKKRPEIFIQHILESIEWIGTYAKNMSFAKFKKSTKDQDAIIRRFEIIGEAAKNLPADFKKKHKNIAWDKIAGMRDVLIHHYFGIDLDLVWKTIHEDLPSLKEKLNKLL